MTSLKKISPQLKRDTLVASLPTADAFPVRRRFPPSENSDAIFEGRLKRRPEMRLLFAG